MNHIPTTEMKNYTSSQKTKNISSKPIMLRTELPPDPKNTLTIPTEPQLQL